MAGITGRDPIPSTGKAAPAGERAIMPLVVVKARAAVKSKAIEARAGVLSPPVAEEALAVAKSTRILAPVSVALPLSKIVRRSQSGGESKQHPAPRSGLKRIPPRPFSGCDGACD